MSLLSSFFITCHVAARVIQDMLVLFIHLCDARTHIWLLYSHSPSIYMTLVHTIVIAFFIHNRCICDAHTHSFPANVGLAQARPQLL